MKPQRSTASLAGPSGFASSVLRPAALARAARWVFCFCFLVVGAHAQQWLVGTGLMTFDSRWSNESFVDIAAGRYHGLARRADGSVVAFGQNNAGQCAVPTLPGGVHYTAIAAGDHHSAAIRSDGQLVVWGDDSEGQHAVPALAPGTTWAQVACGQYHVVALRSDGEVHCWGRSAFGLGTVPTPGVGHVVVQVAAGANCCFLRRDDGEVVGWGDNAAGQLNVAATPPGQVYTFVAAGETYGVGRTDAGELVFWGTTPFGEAAAPGLGSGQSWSAVGCGFNHTVALRSDGAMLAWGRNDKLQINLPPLPSGATYVQAAAFGLQTILRRSDGRIVTWGDFQALPPELPSGVGYVTGSSRHQHAVALRTDGRVVAWGLDDHGQVSGVPALPLGMYYTAIGTGFRHSVALRNDGVLVGWGDNTYGQYGLYGLTNVAEIAVGSWFTLARTKTGAVLACGYNGDGQLGVASLPSGHYYTMLAAGGAHVLGGRSDGDVVGWGRNVEGQSGFGTMLPHAVLNLSGGEQHSVAVRSDGTLLAWGDNTHGQCTVPAHQDFVQAAAGDGFTLGLRSSGTLLAFGTNADHQLDVPQAPSGFEVASMTAGSGRAIVAFRPKRQEDLVQRTWSGIGRTVIYDRDGDGRREFANAAYELHTWQANGSLGQSLLDRRYSVFREAAAFGDLGSGSHADAVSVDPGAVVFMRTDPGFNPIVFPTGEQARHVVMCDVDGNGLQDAVVALAGSSFLSQGSIAVAANPWDPSKGFTISQQPGGVGSILRVYAGDLDGDGDPDVAALSRGNPDRIQLYANDGLGVFALVDTIVLSSANEVADFEVVDLDADGALDFVVATPGLLTGGNRLLVLIRNGPGLVAASYTATTIPLPSGHVAEVAAGHLVAGGTRPDVVCNDLVHGGVWVLHDYQGGTFTSTEQRLLGVVANTIEVGDCNGDAVDDIAYSWFARSTYGVSLTRPQALLEAYGTGCAGQAGVPIADANGLPISGSSSFRLLVSQARPTSVALLFGSLDAASLPLLPSSCTLLLDAPISLGFALTTAAGTGSLPMPLPFGFNGVSLYFQWVVIDATGAYADFATFSNGLRTQLGN